MTEIANTQPSQVEAFKRDLYTNRRLYGSLLRADEPELLRYMAEVHQAITANPKLLDADRGSLLAAIGTAASLGLSVMPQMGEAWLIPRNKKVGNSWIGFVNFQVGAKGLTKLMYRSNDVDAISAEVAYVGEEYSRTAGTDPRIVHVPDDGGELRTNDLGDIVAAYSVVWLKSSSRPVVAVVGRQELTRVRASTASAKTPYRDAKPFTDVWRDHVQAMAQKTAIIRVAKLVPRTDSLRQLHRVVEHELMLEAGKEPMQFVPELDGLKVEGPAPRQGLAGIVSQVQQPEQAGPGPEHTPVFDDAGGQETVVVQG